MSCYKDIITTSFKISTQALTQTVLLNIFSPHLVSTIHSFQAFQFDPITFAEVASDCLSTLRNCCHVGVRAETGHVTRLVLEFCPSGCLSELQSKHPPAGNHLN